MFTLTPSMEATTPTITPQANSNNNNLTFPALLKPLYLTHQNRLEKSPELRQAFAYFIPPDTTASPSSSAREPLDDTAKRFLDQLETLLFLLIGDSGGGKSVFANHLEKTLWENYFLHQGRVPLFIELKSLAQIPAGENFLSFHLQKCGYSLEEIESLRTQYQWVFIFDGFDEMSGALKETNLYQMGHLAQWQALTIITCRHEYLIGEVTSVAWSPTGQLASGSYDCTVILWDLQTGQPQIKLTGHTSYVTSVAWSTTKQLASGSDDHTVILWDLQTHQPQMKLTGHTNRITSVAWSSTGELASGSDDHTVILWDLQTGQPKIQLLGHTDRVTSVAWSSIGEFASGSEDHTVILWDLQTCQPHWFII